MVHEKVPPYGFVLFRSSTALIFLHISPLHVHWAFVANGPPIAQFAIADKIIVTVGTVKKHLNTIYGKLGVGSRTQAIVRAREVRLLE